MKRYLYKYIVFSAWAAISCEDTINPDLEPANPILVVDAWVNNLPQTQVIKLSQTQPYFENQLPPPLPGAQVTITDNENNTFNFIENDGNPGHYEWQPDANTPAFGKIGNQYQLQVVTGGQTYQAQSKMNRVVPVDSITFRFEPDDLFFPETFLAEFWARDFQGPGDAYWIKTYKNGVLLNKPVEINVAFDAGFSEGGNFDGTIFIQPIRAAINPVDEDENDEILPPYDRGDSVYVEIHSINKATFTYLTQVILQTDRPGGFAELFSSPIANVSTNLTNTDLSIKDEVVGFFNVAAVSGLGKKLEQ